VSAQKFDPALPDVPFVDWLNATLRPHGVSAKPPRQWVPTFCDERLVESGARSRSNSLCTVAYFRA
jgi:hypothetical protein